MMFGLPTFGARHPINHLVVSLGFTLRRFAPFAPLREPLTQNKTLVQVQS
jgi:hypothetical protein